MLTQTVRSKVALQTKTDDSPFPLKLNKSLSSNAKESEKRRKFIELGVLNIFPPRIANEKEKFEWNKKKSKNF